MIRNIPDEGMRRKFAARLERQGYLQGRELVNFNIDMISLLQVRIDKNDKQTACLLVQYLQDYQTDKTNKYR